MRKPVISGTKLSAKISSYLKNVLLKIPERAEQFGLKNLLKDKYP